MSFGVKPNAWLTLIDKEQKKQIFTFLKQTIFFWNKLNYQKICCQQ